MSTPSSSSPTAAATADGKQQTKQQLKVALCQLLIGTDKAKNLEHTASFVRKAVTQHQPDIIMLPEIFNSPYSNDSFPVYAEPIPSDLSRLDAKTSPSVHLLRQLATELRLCVVGGSIPERGTDGEEKDKLYNTSLVFGADGNLLAKHRKVHLFDIDVPGKITFKESETLSPGNTISTFSYLGCTFGLGICYDIRFAAYAQICAQRGAKVLLYPGAFNTVTGPAHWELLQRARAVDNQLFVVACSPARNPESKYQAWGHSTVVDPWGEVVATTGHEEALVVSTLNLARLDEVRANIPIRNQFRKDLYAIQDLTK